MDRVMRLYMRLFPASKRQAAALGEQIEQAGIRRQKAEARQAAKIQELKSELEALKKEQRLYGRKLLDMQEELLGYVRENNWAAVFSNTVAGSEWLKDQSFSFGRWAVGYPCAYLLFRILNEIKPETILELGLGQSTKIISQYADSRAGAKHLIIEGSPDWTAFFTKNYELGRNSRIVCCGVDAGGYKKERNIYVFDGFYEKIAGRKFGLIMIDAPWDGGMREYARIDLLQNLPDCLEDSFIILMNGVEKDGVRNTYEEIKDKLCESSIAFDTGMYIGKTRTGVIVSTDLKYVLTM